MIVKEQYVFSQGKEGLKGKGTCKKIVKIGVPQQSLETSSGRTLRSALPKENKLYYFLCNFKSLTFLERFFKLGSTVKVCSGFLINLLVNLRGSFSENWLINPSNTAK